MPRFVFSINAVKDARDLGGGDIHLKIRYGTTVLRTKDYLLENGKATIDESFCFGVPPRPKSSDVITVQLRVNGLLSSLTKQSTKAGKVDIPLERVFSGNLVSKWFYFDDKGGAISCQIHLENIEIGPPPAELMDAVANANEESQRDGNVSQMSFLRNKATMDNLTMLNNTSTKSLPPPPQAVFQPEPPPPPPPPQIIEVVKKVPQRTFGSQTDRLTLSNAEIDAMLKRIPDPSSNAKVDASITQQGDQATMQTRPNDRGRSIHSRIPLATEQLYLPPAMRDHETALSPAKVQAMKAACPAWPDDEVEGILLYCQQLEQENERARTALAKQSIQLAREAAAGLRHLGKEGVHATPARTYAQPSAKKWLETAPVQLGLPPPTPQEVEELEFLYQQL